MKNKSFTFFVMLFVCFISYNIFGQTLTKNNNAELVRLFAKDVQLKGDPKVNYDNYQSTRVQLPFSYSKVLTLQGNQNGNRDIEKIIIIPTSSVYSQLSEKIIRYANDINRAYGCEVTILTVCAGTHTSIKNLILSEQTDLSGVVFIGDIPAAWYEVENDFNEYGYAVWPCDLYYMCLNSTWEDNDENGIFDAHTGDIQPNIFVGRISTANMGKLIPEIKGLDRYFDKNHNFWIGNTTVNKQFGLTYTDKDWAIYNDMRTDIRHLYGDSNYEQIKYGDGTFSKTDYLKRLKNDKYEFIQLACHANHEFLQMSGGDIFASQIYNNGSQAIGYNLFSCSACNWTAVSPNSNHGFLGGAHAYNANNSSLVVVGSTKTGSMLVFNKFYIPLGQGKTIGESLKLWWINAYGSTHSQDVISWHYGMSIIGDPMVNFHYQCLLSWEIGAPAANDVIATFKGGTLTITGDGAMQEWNSPEDVPWIFLANDIKNIIIDQKITTIGEYAFSGCSNLTEIHCQNPVPLSLGAHCFDGVIQANCLLYLPDGTLCAYDAAPVWKDFAIVGLPFTITLTANSGGDILGEMTASCGDNITIHFKPNAGYIIAEVWIDGVLNPQAIIDGCYTFSNIAANHEISVIFTLGINDEIAKQLQIFPNPAQTEIFVNSDVQIEKIEIYSITGDLLRFENNFKGKISVSDLAQGIYLLKVYTDKGVVYSKFVKE